MAEAINAASLSASCALWKKKQQPCLRTLDYFGLWLGIVWISTILIPILFIDSNPKQFLITVL